MRIKKIAPATPANGNIENTYGTSQENTYSQEYINKVTDYSTTEQVIGKWIDGKPLYRKVIDFTISSTWQDVGTFSNVNFFTKIQLVRKTSGNAYPYYLDSNNYCYAYIPATKTRIIIASSSNENGNDGSLVVEYTKTTD